MRFVFICLFLSIAGHGFAASFETNAKAWSDDHAAAFESAANLSGEGYPAAGNEILDQLATEDGGPVAAFVVGNLLYSSDPAASYRLHLRALQALPHEPLVALQLALDQHRRGEYASAASNYRLPIAAGTGAQFSALLADCLIRTGQYKAAVAAWNDADHAKHHEAIDFAICTVYGPLSPTQRRGDLIAKIEAGDLAKLTDLILLDLAFDADWWSGPVNNDALDSDLKRAGQLLGRRDPNFQALAVYARLARVAVKNPGDILKSLTDAQLVLGPGARLPADSQTARALCELVVTAKLTSPADLWTAYEAPLRARLATQDHNALRLLCWLAAANHNPVLTELNALGWEEWNDPFFVASCMVDRYRENKLTSSRDSQLLAALALAPDNPTLHSLQIALAGEDVTPDMIAGAIKAEYHKLSFGEFIRDSTTLNRLFAELGKRL